MMRNLTRFWFELLVDGNRYSDEQNVHKPHPLVNEAPLTQQNQKIRETVGLYTTRSHTIEQRGKTVKSRVYFINNIKNDIDYILYVCIRQRFKTCFIV